MKFDTTNNKYIFTGCDDAQVLNFDLKGRPLKIIKVSNRVTVEKENRDNCCA